jgi:CheY-like chemotaxis protein
MGKKILLADDSITIQKVIELTFSDEDFEVVTVGNGRLAVERVQEVRPDVVLCDIIMPEKDGYEVCDFIKKTPGLSQTPVLLLTGAFEPFDKDKAERVKADGFLSKPFEPQALIAKVKDLLQQAASRGGVGTPRTPTPAPSSAAVPPAAAPGLRPTPAPATLPVAASAPTPVPAPVEEATFIPDDAVVLTATPTVLPVAQKPASAPVEDEGFGYVDDSFEAIPEEAVVISTPEPPAMYKAPPEENWAHATVELPLETRAKASIESARAAPEPPVFEEVFEEAPVEAPAKVAAAPTLSAPAPEPPKPASLPPPPIAVAPPAPAPEPPRPAPPVVAAPAPPVLAPEPPRPAPVVALEPEFEGSSFADMAAPEKAAAATASSEAAAVAVPVDMVEKIAQRVVAQISEKVVREIAWEVVPELAEALIKQEIERLKAELQKT